MLHHTFDQDPNDPLCFVWSEVYKNDDALLAMNATGVPYKIYKTKLGHSRF